MTHALPLLAAFISPALFFGGAAAVAAPILIHLLARRRFKRIRWAAMDFLIDAQRRNRRRIRMEEWILLTLRCLAVLLIALLIARPFIRPAGAAALWGASRRSERVFVLDDSLSMAYRSDGESVFDRAKLAVRRLLRSIRNETPDDTVTILRMSVPTKPVESGAYLEDARTEELLARLEALTPTQRSIDPASVIEGIVDMLERSPEVTNAVVYLISDFQRTIWAKADATSGAGSSEGASSDSIMSPLVAWAGDDRGLRLVFVSVGAEKAGNLAITDLGIRSRQLVAGTAGTVRVTVANFTSESIDNLELALSVGNRPQPTNTLGELASQQTANVEVETEFLRTGYESITLELPVDPSLPGLPSDNVRYLAAQVTGAINVLVVDGEPSADEFADEVTFLTTALRPEGEVFSGNEITVVDEAQLEEISLTRFHLVVLANVYRVGEPGADALERFVREGGGLLVFLGDQVDADLYNAVLHRAGDGILPAALTEVIRAPGASHLIVTDALHPAMRGISGDRDPLGLGQVPFFAYFECVPSETADEESGIGERDGSQDLPTATNARGPARVLARFNDADEHPAVVERRFGRGRVVLVTTTADKEWHHWPDHPTFLPAMMELARHVARRSDPGRKYHVGQAIELRLDPAAFEPDALVRTPAYPGEREIGLTATPAADGHGLALRWEHTDVAGYYQFVLKHRAGGPADVPGGPRETVRSVAVNVDPRESDLRRAGADELRQAMGNVPFDFIDGIEALGGGADDARTELWRICLAAAVLVLRMEQSLAWFGGRRR